MHTRSMNNLVQQRQLTDGTVRYLAPWGLLTQHASATQEPTCFSNAVNVPELRNAMQLEFNALLHNQTWSLVPPQGSQNLIGCKWVFKLKRKANGSIERHKARLVAKGFHQQVGVDYGETYSPIVKPTTIRTVLSLAYSAGWSMKQIDIQNAFLHGLLSEDVHMVQPPGFINPNFPHHVCKLHKAIYGLKQEPRDWFSRLSNKLIQLGFVGSKANSSLFLYKTKSVTLFMLIYVNDIIITASDPVAIPDLLQLLNVDFAVKDLGDLHYFLGVEVLKLNSGLLLSQRRYIMDLLKKTNMHEAKPITSPMASLSVLSAFSGDPMKDPSLYCSTVGSLQYLSLTRPSLSFAVNRVCQFMHRPLNHIGKPLKEFSDTCSIHCLMGSFFIAHLPMFFKLTWMLIGLDVQMIVTPTVHIVYFLVQIWYFGAHANNPLSLGHLQKQSIRLLQTPQPNSYGSRHYFKNLVFGPLLHQLFGVIILAPPTCPLIRYSMLVPSMWKLISTLSEIALVISAWWFDLFLAQISLPMSLQNHLFRPSFNNFVSSSTYDLPC
jgi:hypothetical protein